MNKRMTLRMTEEEHSLDSIFSEYREIKRLKGCVPAVLDAIDMVQHVMYKDLQLTGEEPVTILTEDLMYQWIEVMNQRSLKAPTIQHYLGYTNTLVRWGSKQGYLPTFQMPKVTGQEERIKFYTDAEVERLIRKPSPSAFFTEWRTWIMVSFMLATGARAGTMVEIKLEDIDLVNREVIYRHLKNKQIAIIPISIELAKNIKLYLNKWRRTNPNGWLLCDGAECQFTVNGMRQALEVYCKRRGVECRGQHALRHTFARGWIRSGGNAFKLQRLLTHSSLSMTQHYVKLFSNDLKEDFENYCPLDLLSHSKAYTIKKEG